jgi:hypothetical protein
VFKLVVVSDEGISPLTKAVVDNEELVEPAGDVGNEGDWSNVEVVVIDSLITTDIIYKDRENPYKSERIVCRRFSKSTNQQSNLMFLQQEPRH